MLKQCANITIRTSFNHLRYVFTARKSGLGSGLIYQKRTMASELRIFNPGQGIFETHVTWKDVETAMQEAFQSDAKLVGEPEIRDISGGDAALSKIGVADAEWSQTKTTLPNRFVVKICTLLNEVEEEREKVEDTDEPFTFVGSEQCIEREKEFQKFHNKEIELYELMNESNEIGLKFPKIYASRPFSSTNPGKGFLVMEYFEDPKLIQKIDGELLTGTLRSIAKLQQLGQSFREKALKNFLADGFSEVWNFGFTEENQTRWLAGLRESYGDKDQKNEKILDEVAKLLPQVRDPKFLNWTERCKDLDFYNVLCHGDMHGSNVLWVTDSNGKLVPAVIDFQLAHFGSPAFDLAYVFAQSLSNLERRRWKEHLKEFYKMYSEIGIAEYEYEALEVAFRRQFPLWCLLRAFDCSSASSGSNVSAEKDSENETNEDGVQRSITLLEDFLMFHPKNWADFNASQTE